MRDEAAAAAAIEAFLKALGHDPGTEPALRGTGARVSALFDDELLDGYRVDLRALLGDGIALEPGQGFPIVAVQRLGTHVVCPHHLTLGVGRAAVVYLPGDRVVGLGALGQLVDACTHRLTLQEDAGQAIAHALMEHVGARGAGCMLALRHGCLEHHGARKRGAIVRTVSLAGSFDHAGKDRDLALAALFERPRASVPRRRSGS
jgi:GTP cyclohydrolase I